MKYLKMLMLLAVAGAALMVGPGSASATQLTSPAGTVYTGGIKAVASGPVTFHGEWSSHTCLNSVIEAKVEQHGLASTAAGKINKLTFTECNNVHMAVIKPGALEFHTDSSFADGNGTVTLAGTEITYVMTNIFGNLHCTMEAPTMDLGTLTGSKNTGATARIITLRIADPTNIFCPKQVDWTANYVFTTPDYLDVD
jgi:hypothetical protein